MTDSDRIAALEARLAAAEGRIAVLEGRLSPDNVAGPLTGPVPLTQQKPDWQLWWESIPTGSADGVGNGVPR